MRHIKGGRGRGNEQRASESVLGLNGRRKVNRVNMSWVVGKAGDERELQRERLDG